MVSIFLGLSRKSQLRSRERAIPWVLQLISSKRLHLFLLLMAALSQRADSWLGGIKKRGFTRCFLTQWTSLLSAVSWANVLVGVGVALVVGLIAGVDGIACN